MSDYRQMPRDKKWLALIAMHNAAAELALHDEECPCSAGTIYWNDGDSMSDKGHRQYTLLCDLVRGTLDYAYDGDPTPLSLYRGDACVAQWRTIN